VTDWSNSKLLELLKMAATPIDFDQLIADRVLRKHGAKYELLDLARLPEHARRKIRIIATSRKTPNPVVSFHKPSKQAVQQAKKMGLLPADQCVRKP
jgi:predicted outer membrane protein